MTKTKRRPLSAFAFIAVVGVIGACGSAALAGTDGGHRARDTKAVNHEKAGAASNASVSTAAAPARSLPSRGSAGRSTSFEPQEEAAGARSAPADVLPGPTVRAPLSSASGSAPSAIGTLPVRTPAATQTGSASAPARSLPDQ